MIAYFDMFSGVSGDMILGALIDAGLDPRMLRESLRELPLPPFELEVSRVRRGTLAATLAAWRFQESRAHRHLSEIERILREASLPPPVEELSIAVFRRLAEAEARVHGVSASEVHFHEVGAVDAILDVCGAASALHLLGIQSVRVSAFRTGSGYVDTAHGRLPVPAPAVAFLLEGWRVEPGEARAELTTPTGAAILTALADPAVDEPELRVRKVGYGAGSREGGDPPNCLRVILGDATGSAASGPAAADGTPAWSARRLTVLETTIDDMNPQLYGWIEERLAAEGALEVALVPASLKRGRPGTLVRCLCEEEAVQRLAGVLFRETTTIGVRTWPVRRLALPRREETLATSFGPVRVKRVRSPGGGEDVRPEYEECRRLAQEHGLPLRVVQARLRAELGPRGEGDGIPAGGGRADSVT
ncbi:MAG: nickel pincer cofactor biosynthesis protein LarC [Gemmatimonadota bacterium]